MTNNDRDALLALADLPANLRRPMQLLREKLANDEDGWRALLPIMDALATPSPQAWDLRGEMLEFITETPEDVTHKRLVSFGWTPPQADKARGEVVAWRIEWSPGYGYYELTNDRERIAKIRTLENAPPIDDLYTNPQPQGDGKQGWYCARCQSAVPPVEVTYQEAHTECGRIITNDTPQARPETTP